ncbi:ACP S-malonyltransferase [Myxococcus sp. 1LA]
MFLFSGQGTQSYFMAKELFDTQAGFKRQLCELDAQFKQRLGHSVLERIYDPRAARLDPLDDVLVSFPAIFMIEHALARLLIERGIQPDAVVGASMGEVAAATTAGALSMEAAVAVVAAQAQLFARAAPRGGMLAVLHELDVCRGFTAVARDGEIAAINYPSNFVIAADEAGLGRIQQELSQRSVAFHRLPVRYPFHSSHLDPLREEYRSRVRADSLSWPRITMFSCTTANRVQDLRSDHFWNVVRAPIRLYDTVQQLESQGGCDYIDVGPAASFATIIKRILTRESSSRLFPLLSPFSRVDRELEGVTRSCAGSEAPTPRAPAPVAVPASPWATHTRGAASAVVNARKAAMFPGQGSQERGMGAALFDEFPDLTDIADGILGYSIKRLCLEDPGKELAQTQFTQPALYVVNALSYLKRLREGAEQPAFVAGHSLGEYNALLVAGAFDFETGLRLVKRRGELMSAASGGTMAAVVGCDAAAVEQVLRDHQLTSLDIANINSPDQIVVSGPAQDIERARQPFVERGARYVPLNVRAPFHSRYMQPAASEFERFLSRFEYAPLRCVVISNVTGRPYSRDNVVQGLALQLRSPVQWTATVRYLLEQGVEDFEELGPGRVLTRLITANKRNAPAPAGTGAAPANRANA